MSLNQLPPGERAEIIPFQATVPPSIREVSSDLYDFLRDTTEHLRVQHEKTQVGDTTLPWENLLEVDLAPRYTPGVEGRFYHEKYGIIRGRYVRFMRVDVARGAGPAGLVTGENGLSWCVTNQIQQTVDGIPRGVIAAFVVPAEKSYGWIITQGINLSVLPAGGKAQDYLTWESDGSIKAMGDGRPFAQVMIPGDSIQAAGCLIDTYGLAGAGYNGGSIAGAPLEFGDQILELRQRLELLDGESKLGIEYLQRRVTSLTKDRASIELTEKLSAFANFANISETASQNANRDAKLTYVNLLATNEFSRKAAVYRTEAGFFAESSTYMANEATVQSNLAETRAIAAETSSASASDSAAEAKRQAELAASFAGNGSSASTLSNSNANFSEWPDGQYLPTYWQDSQFSGTARFVERVPGKIAKWAMQQTNPGDADLFLVTSGDPSLEDVVNPGLSGLGYGWFVAYGEFELVEGDLIGAGLYLALYRADKTSPSQAQFMSFPASVEAGGVGPIGPGTIGRRYVVAHLWNLADPNGVSLRFHPMTSWAGFGPNTPKKIKWHAAGVRPATPQEIAANRAAIDIVEANARIGREERARADRDQALAESITSIDTDFKKGYTPNAFRVGAVGLGATAGQLLGLLNSRNEFLYAQPNRGYTVLTFNEQNQMLAPYAFDTLGGLYNGGAQEFANYLASLPNGRTVVIYTYDEPQSNRLLPDLIVQIRRFGGGPKFESATFGYRSAYILIGRAGIGEGNGIELYNDVAIETTFYMMNGVPSLRGDGGYIETKANISRIDRTTSDLYGAIATSATNLIAQYTARDNELINDYISRDGQILTGAQNYTLARIGEESIARANAIGAEATRITNLTTTVNGHTTTLTAYGSSIDGIRGKYGVTINANGAITGFELIGGGGASSFIVQADRFLVQTPGGSKTPFEVNGSQVRLGVDLYAGNNKLIFDTGTVMMMMGVGFGTQNQFVIWLGPTRAANQCDEASGLFYFRVDGRGYYGGALNAGIKVNPIQTTSTAGDASVTTGNFGSEGKTRVVTVNYAYRAQDQNFGACPAPANISATIQLFRGTDANGAFITEQTIQGQWTCRPGNGSGEAGNITNVIEGSFTYNDNTGGTSTSFFARLSGRNVTVGGGVTQVLSIVSVEQ